MRSNSSYYLPPRKTRAAEPATTTWLEPGTPVEPIVGLPAIAARLKIDVAQLRRMRKADKTREIPIEKVPGLGLTADGPTIDAWWESVLRRRAR